MMGHEIGQIFETFLQKRAEIEIPLAQMKQEISVFADRIVLYGAGSAGIAFVEYLRDAGLQPRFFADANVDKWGKKCQGLEILSPEQIAEKAGADALVIVCINTDGVRYCKSFAEALRIGGHQGVHRRLQEAGCKNVVDYTYFRRCFALFHGDPYNLPSCSDVAAMLQGRERVEMVYERLADELSRETYRKIVAFRLLDDTIRVPTLPQDDQYFEPGLYRFADDEAYVDCGAYNGVTLKTFLRMHGERFERYHAIEPDAANFEQLEAYLAALPQAQRGRIETYPWAAYDMQGEKQLYALQGPGSFLSATGDQTVMTDTIDHMLDGRRASCIKMNIEGSEMQALQGAEQTIRRFQPVLAVAGYHKTWDLWEVPRRILEYCPDYRLYLRSYMNHISFVYYALPENRLPGKEE